MDRIASIDSELTLESLKFKQTICSNTKFETYEERQEALEQIANVIEKVRNLSDNFLLNVVDLDLILISLKDTKEKFENYTYYPDAEFKQSQLDRVTSTISKVRTLRNGLLNESSE